MKKELSNSEMDDGVKNDYRGSKKRLSILREERKSKNLKKMKRVSWGNAEYEDIDTERISTEFIKNHHSSQLISQADIKLTDMFSVYSRDSIPLNLRHSESKFYIGIIKKTLSKEIHCLAVQGYQRTSLIDLL